jgi:uncharacterized protein YjbI with pentapeptide repeats
MAKRTQRFAVDDVNLAGASFHDVNLAQARFVDVDLSGAFFDDIDFRGAQIGSDCNFEGMTIAGVPVKQLLALHQKHARRSKTKRG